MHHVARLQLFTSACLNRFTLLVHLHDALPALVTVPSEGTQSLAEDRVAEVVARVHPVGVHGAQVLDLQLDKRLGQVAAVAQFLRKLVGLELVAPREDIHQQLDDRVHGRERVREQDEADDDGEFVVEAEGLVKRFVVDENGKE